MSIHSGMDVALNDSMKNVRHTQAAASRRGDEDSMERPNEAEKVPVRVEIHVHTWYSFDSNARLEQIEQRAEELGLDCVAVTDHDSIEGALRLRSRGNMGIVIGEEISTRFGDIIGLFLNERIEPGLSPEETIAAIRGQGGLVYIPHPFDRQRKTRLFKAALEQCIDGIDILEVWNGRTRLEEDNVRAARFAEEHSLLPAVGTDAHRPGEMGRANMIMNPFEDAAGFMQALREATPEMNTERPLDSFRKGIARLFNRTPPGE